MAAKPDVRVRAHTTYSVDVHQKPRTEQVAAGLGMNQANDIAEALAARHGGGHHRMTGSRTNYPVENVPTHLGPLYQELLSLPPGAEFTFSLTRGGPNHISASHTPTLVLDRVIPEIVAEGEQTTAQKIGITLDTSRLQDLIRSELEALKPTLDELANDASVREIRGAFTKAARAAREGLPSAEQVEGWVDKAFAATGKAKANLRTWAYESLGDRLGEVALTDRKKEIYASHRGAGAVPRAAYNASGYPKNGSVGTGAIEDLEHDPHVKARILWYRAGTNDPTQPLRDPRAELYATRRAKGEDHVTAMDGDTSFTFTPQIFGDDLKLYPHVVARINYLTTRTKDAADIAKLTGSSTEAEIRAAIRVEIFKHRDRLAIFDRLVASTGWGMSKFETLRGWILEEDTKINQG